MGSEQARQVIGNLVGQEATTLAVDHTFFISAIVLMVAAAIVWIAPRSRPAADMSNIH